jgi:hypothetical protein
MSCVSGLLASETYIHRFFISAESGEGLFLVKNFPYAGASGSSTSWSRENFVRVNAKVSSRLLIGLDSVALNPAGSRFQRFGSRLVVDSSSAGFYDI